VGVDNNLEIPPFLRRVPYLNKVQKHCIWGSLTGAVASQRVTEVCEGKLNERRKLSVERNGKSLPDCESDTSSRDESRP